jgi:rRNA pseudouridine-1189 N-methylase Emg1 (Nep1/Mra1 family)
VRRILLSLALLLVALPLEAQKSKKRDQYKITAEELAEYGEASMSEVIPKARPNFLMFNAGGGAGLGEQTMSGMAHDLVVFVGSMNQGDSSVLRFYKASDVKEVRYFKPGNSLSPQTAGNSFVIQLVMKDRLKEKN